MPAPSIVAGYTTANNTGNGTTLACNVPTHTDGDIIYYAWATDGDSATATISGADWTLVYEGYNIPSTGVPDSGSFYLWKRTASSEPASYTVTSNVSERSVIVAWAVSGDGGIDATGTSASGMNSTIVAPSVTTLENNCLRISIIASVGDRRPVGTLTDHTLMVTHAYSSAATISVQYKEIPFLGVDPAATTTQNGSGWTAHAFAIEPAVTVQTIVPDFIASASTVYSPTLAAGNMTISPDYIPSTATVYSPTLVLAPVPSPANIYTIPAENRTFVVVGES
jgi:hypothetical protein